MILRILFFYFQMAASIRSHFENIKSQSLQHLELISMQFASKCAIFQMLLDKLSLYFCVPFPLGECLLPPKPLVSCAA